MAMASEADSQLPIKDNGPSEDEAGTLAAEAASGSGTLAATAASPKQLLREYNEVSQLATGSVNGTIPVLFSLQKQKDKLEADAEKSLAECIDAHDKVIGEVRNRATARKRELAVALDHIEAQKQAKKEARRQEMADIRKEMELEGRRMFQKMSEEQQEHWMRNHRRCKPGKCLSDDPPRDYFKGDLMQCNTHVRRVVFREKG